jgi:hypothetical protein
MIRGKKYQSSSEEWTSDDPTRGFTCLKFSIAEPQYYMYSYTATGKGALGDSFDAKGEGDLNGDGVLSHIILRGKIASPGKLEVAPLFEEVLPEE